MIGLGFFVFLKNPKQKLNLIFLFFCIAVSWWLFSTFMMYKAQTDSEAIFWDRMVYVGVVFIPILMYHFGLVFTESEKQNMMRLYFGYIGAFIFLLLSRTKYFIDDLYKFNWGLHTQAKIFHHFFFAFFILYIILFLSEIYKFLRKTKKAKMNETKVRQVNYLFISFIIMNIGAYAFLPAYGIDINPLGAYWVELIAVLILAFAITKYHLFEIRVLLTELLVGLMGIILLLQMIFAPTKEWKISAFSIFLLFLIFGYLLIKYTHQEIERREELEKLTKELQKKTTELEQAYKKIEALSEMKSEFLKVVNHQLRTPFSIIRGLVSMMSEGEVSPERQKEFIQKLNLSVERLGIILDDILAAQALVGGVEPPILFPCEIEKVVEMQINRFKLQAQTKGIEILYKKPKEPLPITLADQQMIERIISRLIDNAILYTEKGEVEISLDLEKENNKEWIKISVKDQGIGLDEKDKENLFKLFYRGEKATLMHNNGTGLALFIVKNYVKAHGGKIEAKSEGRGKGSTFIVALPVIKEI